MRYIRLKETPPGVTKTRTPTPPYRQKCDETLGHGPFVQRGTIDGFLDTGNHRPHATRNLVMLGGSFVESMFAAEMDRFPSQIERMLPDDWRILNAGYSGMTTLHMLSLLVSKLVPFLIPNGKLVIFIGQSDTNVLTSKHAYWDPRPTITPIKPASKTQALPWSRVESLERVIDSVLSTADSFGIDYAVVASPYREGNFDTDPVLQHAFGSDRNRYKRIDGIRSLIQRTTRSVAEKHRSPFFDGQIVASDASLFYDIMHLNESGQQVFSDALGAWIRDIFLPDSFKHEDHR